jgi:hypothetical protein
METTREQGVEYNKRRNAIQYEVAYQPARGGDNKRSPERRYQEGKRRKTGLYQVEYTERSNVKHIKNLIH